MGAYLSEPVTEKVTMDETGNFVSYGAASMQGWRLNQEDAHNSILNYDGEDTSFFAVYDGHGGSEVAKYCALNLPDFIKALPSYRAGDIETALKEGFINFDATLITPEVLAKLKMLSDNSSEGDLSGADSTEEDEAGLLVAEADLPIEKVLARYGALLGAKQGILKGDNEDESAGKEGGKEAKLVNGDSSALDEKGQGEGTSSAGQSSLSGVPASSAVHSEQSASCTEGSSKESENKDDGGEGSSGTSSRPRSKPYKALIMDEPISDSSDESSGSSQEADEAGDEENEDDDDEEDDEDGDAEDSNEAEDSRTSGDTQAVGAGFDSGCTAVVGVLKGRKLVVANAGDSRCVVCRSGEALDMSVDHKPEDTTELDRIRKAGGEVTRDGRVNGGLNLSRAIGDHGYKANVTLGPEEQMITALPDIRTLEVNPETDSFMVLACDGIWNSMSSEDVVHFVLEKIKEGVKPLSKICEMIFDRCLAPDTTDDGTGCDNMTCIIVQFHRTPSADDLKKRPAPANGEEAEGNNPAKKSRTEPGTEEPSGEGST